MNVIGIGFLLAILGCATEEQELVDPAGNWNYTVQWGGGSCGFTGSGDASATVTRTATGFAISDGAEAITGSVVCSTDECRFSFTEVSQGQPGSGVVTLTVDANLAVDDIGLISGSGSARVARTDNSSCTHQFTASGIVQ